VKVNGERISGRPFNDGDIAHPEDAYGISKWEAEQTLAQIAKDTSMEVVVLRAPLVYGPGVKANFLQLMQLVARKVPLPFASVRNRRSVLYVGNLVDAIITGLEAPAAAGKTYLLSDDEDVSTPDLIRALAGALDVPARLFPCPVTALRAAAVLLGHGEQIARLVESLQVDSSRIRRELAWRPCYSLSAGIQETAQWFKGVYCGRSNAQSSRLRGKR
jgi:nucleoside-diphosphate-sugar epimerase